MQISLHVRVEVKPLARAAMEPNVYLRLRNSSQCLIRLFLLFGRQKKEKNEQHFGVLGQFENWF